MTPKPIGGLDYIMIDHSRLDYIMIDHSLIDYLGKTRIGIITVSDHAPVMMELQITGKPERQYNWRLNEELLQDRLH